MIAHVTCMFMLLNMLKKFQNFEVPINSNSRTFKALTLEKKFQDF